jgi:hypothetical protein
MAIVPGSGASISPVFNDDLGVDSVIVVDGGSGYDSDNPPVLSIGNAGTPTRAAVLEPVINNGRIVAVRVLDSGEGYDPLRVELTPDVPSGEDQPDKADAKIILREDGSIDYIQVTKNGDGHFYDVSASVVGGGGDGASIRAVPKTVTGLSILNPGRDYETPPFLSITGGGGTGATGAAEIDVKGVVSSNVTISNPGQFYLDAPYVLFTGGGGIGARGRVIVNQGQITDIVVTDPGSGYTAPPSIVFARKVKLKRKSRNRQSYNLEVYNLSGITKNIGRADTSIYLSTTNSYPGSGVVLLEKELIRYTGKDSNRLTGCTRGLNFRYDQRVVLDNAQNDPETGISAYEFNIGDRIIRTQESASSKIAVVYDWIPQTRELFVVFRIDELAFIDAGTPGEKSAVVFDGGIADSSSTFELPHIIIDSEGSVIYQLTEPPSILLDKAFEDDNELDGAGDGYPDLVNTGTTYNNQINLDAGNSSTLYGIEETVGGTNTTLFVAGDTIKDSSVPFKTPTVTDAGLLNEGVEHSAFIQITMDMRNPNNYNGIDFIPGEVVTGVDSLIEATVVSWDPTNKILVVNNPVPYDTGDPEIGFIYEFSSNSTITDIRILDSGNSYTTPITVNIPSAIVNASATAQLTADQITNITVDVGGYGYTSAPEITFTSGSGSGAIVQSILGGEKISGGNGGLWRILSVDYLTRVRNDKF